MSTFRSLRNSLLGLIAATGGIGAEVAAEDAKLRIIVRGEGDKVEEGKVDEKLLFHIKSKQGIGRAIIEPVKGTWPAGVVVRLSLSGLESLTVKSGAQALQISVSSQGGHERRLKLRKGGREGPLLSSESPYWTEVLSFDKNGKAAKGLPGKGGYFELTLPAVLFEDKRAPLELAWIDFYRG